MSLFYRAPKYCTYLIRRYFRSNSISVEILTVNYNLYHSSKVAEVCNKVTTNIVSVLFSQDLNIRRYHLSLPLLLLHTRYVVLRLLWLQCVAMVTMGCHGYYGNGFYGNIWRRHLSVPFPLLQICYDALKLRIEITAAIKYFLFLPYLSGLSSQPSVHHYVLH